MNTKYCRLHLKRTSVSTHCNCPVTVHLIYIMENSSVPVINGLIQHKSKMFIITFLKVPIEILALLASFLVVLNFVLHSVSLKYISKKERKKEVFVKRSVVPSPHLEVW